MSWLARFLGRIVGLHFAPDNYVRPVLRLERYNRVAGPGFFWIIPVVERTLPPVQTSPHVGNFTFDGVLSKDHIPFRVEITILFTFNPETAPKNSAAQLVQSGDELLSIIVKDYTNEGLRRLASKYEAEELGKSLTRFIIQRNLTHFLTAQMRVLGLAPLRDGGIIIKEITAPEKFIRAILNARHIEAFLQAVASYPVPGLIEPAIRAMFVSGLGDFEGDLTHFASLLAADTPPFVLDVNQMASPLASRRSGGP